MSAYPEHDKLDKIKDHTQELGEFLEWLKSKYTLCEYLEDEVVSAEEGYYPVSIDISRTIAEYTGIDYDKLMAEKDQMLADIRKANKS